MSRKFALSILILSLFAMSSSVFQPVSSESATTLQNVTNQVYRIQNIDNGLEHTTDSLYEYVPNSGQIKVDSIDDAYTDSYYYLHNYGASWRIGVGKVGSTWYLGWLKFNISTVPYNAYNVSAALKLNCNNSPDLESEFMEDAPIVDAHHSSSNDWDEESITYDNHPSYNTTILDSQRIYDKGELTGDWFAWNVTEAVVKSLDNNKDLVTMVMKSSKTPWAANPLNFNSKESGWDHPELVVEWSGITYGFPTSVAGFFREDEDGKWRCYANATITNNNEENVTLVWIYLNTLNVTYADETSEELGISGNNTLNRVLQHGENFTTHWNITKLGFDKEPKLLWITFIASFLEFENHVTLTTAIPEFPSFLILPLFMIATLLAVIVYRRKLTSGHSKSR